ncbi:MAG: flagellar biosynthetic protein FliO [Vicinamibacterales bacterium]
MRLFAWSALQAPLEPLASPAGNLRAIAGLVIVLGLLVTLAWLARKGKLRLPGARGRALITVESAVPLGERRSLIVVSVEGRRLLLGCTPAQVSLVTELSATPPASFQQAVDRHAGPPAQGS